MIFVKWGTELIVVLIIIVDGINCHPVDPCNANFLQYNTALRNFVGLIFTNGPVPQISQKYMYYTSSKTTCMNSLANYIFYQSWTWTFLSTMKADTKIQRYVCVQYHNIKS